MPSKQKICDECREQLAAEPCKTPECNSQTSGFGRYAVFCEPCYENLRSIADRHDGTAKPEKGNKSIAGSKGSRGKSTKKERDELVRRVGAFVQNAEKVVVTRSELAEHFKLTDSRVDRAVKEAKAKDYIRPADGYIAGEVKAEAPPEEKAFDYISDIATADDDDND